MATATTPAQNQLFNPRLIVGLIVAGIAAFAALMLLLAFGDRMGSGRTGRANALSVSAVGFKGLVDLTGRLRHSYLIRTNEEFDATNLVVIALEPTTRREQVEQLLQYRSGRPTLIILPKWIVERHPEHAGWIRAVAPGLGAAVAERIAPGVRATLAGQAERARSFDPARGPLRGLRLQVPLNPQLVAGPGLTPLLTLAGSAPPRRPDAEGDQTKPNGRVDTLPLPVPIPAPPIIDNKPEITPVDKPRLIQAPPPQGEGDRAAQLRGGGAGTSYEAATRSSPPRNGDGDRSARPIGGGAGTTYETSSLPPPPVLDGPIADKVRSNAPESDPALIAQIGDEPHYILADPDLLNNQALRDPTRARAAIELLDRLNGPGEQSVGFDLTLNGYGAGEGRSMLRNAFEPPFLAMTLALFIAALLAGLHGANRFGPTRREARAIAFGKAALVENSAGLIRLAGREARLGGAYADVMRHEMARAASAPAHLQGEALDRYLNRLSREGPNFSELAAELATAQTRPALMTAARRLWNWRKTVLR